MVVKYQDLVTTKSRFNFLYLNARSIRKKGKFDELLVILRSIASTIQLIILTETWIANEQQAQELQIPNYTHYYNYRTDSRGGGVSIYAHNNLKHNLSESIYVDGNNYLWINLKNYGLDVGVIYNPGDTNYQNFLTTYELQLQQKKRAIVFGDFNIDLLTKDSRTKQYKYLLQEAGHTILNKISAKYCTRHQKNKKSILDHVTTNLKQDNFHMTIIESSMSDHKQIYVELKKYKAPPLIRTKYEALDYQKLYDLIKNDNFNNIPKTNYTTLENIIKKYIDTSKVMKTKILNLPQKDWINKDVITSINQRNLLWTSLRNNFDNEELTANYNETKEKAARLIQNTKDEYYYKEFLKCSKKPKKMWKLVNTLAKNKIQQSCAPSKLVLDDRETTDLRDICQIGPLTDTRWQMRGGRGKLQEDNVAIHVTPPEAEEDDEFLPTPGIRMRRKLSTPLSALPGLSDGLLGLQSRRSSPTRSLSPLDRTKRRFSTMVSSAAAAAVSRRLSATIGWCLASPTQVKPQIVRQGRALCLQYIKTQIRRSTLCSKKQIVMKRLQRMVETECGEEAISNTESGVLTALRALCAALERKRPDAFRHVARQATRAPSAMLRSDTALAELALALARRITRENITWSKIAAVYCVCGALAKEAAEAADGEPALELVAAPAAAIADLLHEEPGSWVASHGGWNGLIERLRASERDQRSEKNLRVMVSFFALACLTLLLFRWVVQAHPSYNYDD